MPYDSRKHHKKSGEIFPKLARVGRTAWNAFDRALKGVGSRVSYAIAIITAAYFALSLIGVLPRPIPTSIPPAPGAQVAPVATPAPVDRKDITTGAIPQPSKSAPTLPTPPPAS